MKVLVLGGSGMLGHKLTQMLGNNFEVWTTLRCNVSRFEKLKLFDVHKTFENVKAEDYQRIREIINIVRPEVTINAIGIIKQIPSAQNIIDILTINSIFPHKLSEITKEFNSRLITISTDCVFRGEKGNYSEEDISDAFDLYGKSKNLGEVVAENCLTLRTSIIGRELTSRHSLVEWFLSNRGEKV
ncbi:MAG TPA: sugar nucleotide-binding protein, partial [Pyrinomonadaceae bacterium]